MRKRVPISLIVASFLLVTALAAVNPASAAGVLKSCKETAKIALKTISLKTPSVLGNPGATVDPTNAYQFKVPVTLYPDCATKTYYCSATCYLFGRVKSSSTSGGAGGTVRLQVQYSALGFVTAWGDYGKAAGCRVGSGSTTNQACQADTKKVVLSGSPLYGTYVRVLCDWKSAPGLLTFNADKNATIACELWQYDFGGGGG